MKITLDKARELLEAMGYEVAEQAEQEPVAIVNHEAGGSQKVTWLTIEGLADGAELYLHPVRTKDLTDDEIDDIGDSLNKYLTTFFCDFARAVIAADREKNKCST